MTAKPFCDGPFSVLKGTNWIVGKDHHGDICHVLDQRGWGYLTGKGQSALGLDSATASAMQADMQQWVVDALNAAWNRRADLAAVPAQVRVKPLDLSNALKHAFIAGRVSAGAASSFHADAWVEYDPTESAGYTRILAAIEPQPDPRDEHFDDYAVRSFAKMMAAKMAASRAKGRGGWSDPKQCSVEYLRRLLYTHLDKGDPVDVANICMMLRHYEASTAHEYESSAMAAACASRDEVLARLVDALRLYGCDCEQCAEGVIAALAAAKAVQHG